MSTKNSNLKTLFFAALFLGLNDSHAQTFEWAKSFGSSVVDVANSIAVDVSGNVYTTGYFRGTVDFDTGAGTSNLTSAGGRDIFVHKMDANGNFLWARSFGATSDDEGYSIAVDASGNVYSTGYFQGTVDFDPGTGTSNLTSAPVSWDAFVQKLDANGNLVWAKSFGGADGVYGNEIAVDASENVYTTGNFWGTADFNPGSGTNNLISVGQNDVFVQKLDASGDFLWAKSFGGSSGDAGNSIAVDASGNVYSTGLFLFTVDFDPGPGTYDLNSVGGRDVFVQKLDGNGNFLWAKSFGGTSSDYGISIAVDASGTVHTTGYFVGTVDFDPSAGTSNLTSEGDRDTYVHKMDTNGNLLWAKSFGGTSDDQSSSIAVDVSGNVYTTGHFFVTVDFDPGPGTYHLTSGGYADFFIQKLDVSGNFLWANSYGGSLEDHDIGHSVVVDASGNVYTTGLFAGTVDFDSGIGTSNLTSTGQSDVFVLKISQTTVSLQELNNGVTVMVYPNPSEGTVHVTMGEAISHVELRLSDVQGKVISTQTFRTFKHTTIDLPEAKGIYFLTTRTRSGERTIKLVKK